MQKVFFYDDNVQGCDKFLIKMIEEDGYKVINSCYIGNNSAIYILEEPQKQNKKTENKKAEKHKYGEYKHVLLSDKEYDKLLDDFGQEELEKWIKRVDEYCEMYKNDRKKGKYSNFNLVIRKWKSNEINTKQKVTKVNESLFDDIQF